MLLKGFIFYTILISIWWARWVMPQKSFQKFIIVYRWRSCNLINYILYVSLWTVGSIWNLGFLLFFLVFLVVSSLMGFSLLSPQLFYCFGADSLLPFFFFFCFRYNLPLSRKKRKENEARGRITYINNLAWN